MSESKAQKQIPTGNSRVLVANHTEDKVLYQTLYANELSIIEIQEMKSSLVTYIETLIELDKQATTIVKPWGDIVERNVEN